MSAYAIIAEYNPFHNGHKYLAECAKQDGAGTIIAVMSGNWVQRGDAAILPKFLRTEQALSSGIDIVLELPTYYAMATAQKFALGAAEIIKNTGADTLIFGSECGDTDLLIRAAETLRSDECKTLIKEYLKEGFTLASVREKVLDELCSLGYLLKNPNDTLAIEYILAFKELGYNISFKAIKRIATQHDSNEFSDDFCSARFLRENIKNDTALIRKFMPEKAATIFIYAATDGKTADISRLDRAIITKLRSMSIDDFKNLPDISEGLENRIANAVKSSASLDELIEAIKTKRYTTARLRRIVLSAFLGESIKEMPSKPTYLRVLGYSQNGSGYLKKIREVSALPVIMRATEIKDDPVFQFEARATDLYSLAQENPDPCGTEFSNGIIKY